MIKRLTYNYWLMILAWCMILSDYYLIAIAFSITACALLARKIRERNNWRMLFVMVAIYCVALFILPNLSITYFFPKFHSFYLTIAINAGLTSEYISKLKVRSLLPYLAFMVVAYSAIMIISFFLSNSSYSLFGKNNLFMMEAFIFLPYLIPLCCFYISKLVKIYYKRKHSIDISIINKRPL